MPKRADRQGSPRTTFAGVLGLCLALCGCGVWHDVFGSKEQAIDHGASCARDDVGLQALLRTPLTCPAHPCPNGSHCDTETGTCDFQCILDTDCPSGSACSCDGRCFNPQAVGDAGALPDPLCPKVASVLASIQPNDAGVFPAGGAYRSCEFDDICPHGAFCDRKTGRCAYECTTDQQCTPTDAGPRTCSCYGHCENATPTVRPIARELPALSISPALIELPSVVPVPVKPSFQPRDIDATVTSVIATVGSGGAIQGPPVALRVIAGRFLEVACPVDAMGTLSAFAKECPVGQVWTWKKNADVFQATIRFKVRPSSETPMSGETSPEAWTVKVESADVSEAPRVLQIKHAPALPLANVPVPDAFVGGFHGSVQFTLEDQSEFGNPSHKPETATFTLPVTAWGRLLDITFYDPTRTLSSTGTFVVPVALDQFNSTHFWQPEAPGVKGGFKMFVNPLGTQVSQQTGAVVGKFQLTVETGNHDTVIQGSFRLVRDASVNRCNQAGASPCPNGYSCNNVGFCSLEPLYESTGAGAITPTIDTDARGQWQGATSLDRIGASPTLIDRALTALMTQNTLGRSQDISNYVCGLVHETTPANFLLLMPLSGEGECSGTFGRSNRAVPLITHLDTEQPNPSSGVSPMFPATASELFASCVQELKRTPTPRPCPMPGTQGQDCQLGDNSLAEVLSALGPGYFATSRSTVGSVLEPPPDDFSMNVSCVSLGNFFAVLRALGATSVNPNYTFRKEWNHLLYANTLRMWAEMHAFIARQGAQGQELDSALSSDTQQSDDLRLRQDEWKMPATDEEVLDILERGWAVLATELPQIDGLMPSVVKDPDYLRFVHPSSVRPPGWPANPEHDRRFGLAPAMLEMEAAHLGFVEHYLRKVDAATYETALGNPRSINRERAFKRAGNAIRGAFILHEAAKNMHETATTMCSPQPCFAEPPWEARWKAALDEYRAARARVLELVSQMGTHRNPLGVEENDLPLFFGDPAGTNSRFFASSDYLMNQWAVPAVTTALGSLNAAREAWIAGRNSRVQDKLLAADQDRRIDGIAAQYGRAVVENCGLEIDAKDVFADAAPAAETCFVNPECKGARVDTSSLNDRAAQLTANVLKRQFYKFSLLRTQEDLTLSTALSGCLDILGALADKDPTHWNLVLKTTPGVAPKDQDVNCNGIANVPNVDLYGDYGQSSVGTGDMARIDDEVSRLFGSAPLPTPQIDPHCYRGRIGEAVSRMVAAKSETDAAAARLNVSDVSAGEKAGLCLEMMKDDADAGEARGALDQIRSRWRFARSEARAADTDAALIEGMISGGELGGKTGNPIVAMGGAMVGGIFESDKAEKDARAQAADDELRIAESKYNDLLQSQSRAENIRACWGEFHTLRASIEADVATIQARVADVNTAIVQISSLVSQTKQALTEGTAAMAREKKRPYNGYSHHYWLAEKAQTFARDFEWAKRLTFLAMRAVEYDFQQSLNLRSKILTAEHPTQLQEVIRVLQQEQASRTINRRRPEESSMVVSIRDDVLRVADRTSAPAGERAWSPALRFRGRLSHPEFAVYDDDGSYMGQGIPFSLDRVTGTGQGGVALAHRCAERMWRLAATIQGDGLSDREPGAPVFLLKRNTFSSQWCSGRGQAGTDQTSSLQPSRQLFRPSDTDAPVDEARGFSAAVLYPWFNIRRSDFYKKQYQEGASEELAGRGLYGDHILLFPKELLDKGFPLDRVEDVLLRVDYLSIDNLPNVAN